MKKVAVIGLVVCLMLAFSVMVGQAAYGTYTVNVVAAGISGQSNYWVQVTSAADPVDFDGTLNVRLLNKDVLAVALSAIASTRKAKVSFDPTTTGYASEFYMIP